MLQMLIAHTHPAPVALTRLLQTLTPPELQRYTHDVPLFLCKVQSFRSFSPGFTLHTAITHVISALEWQRLMHDYAIGIYVRLHCSNTYIT